MAKKNFKPDYNACIGKNRHENFGSIYESMVKSEQFRSLSNPASNPRIKMALVNQIKCMRYTCII